MRVIAWFAYKSRWLNPYNALLYDAIVQQGIRVDEFSPLAVLRERYDIFHVHWPDLLLNHRNPMEALAKSIALFGLLDVARRRGARVVWTIHNLQSHERRHPRLERAFWPAFLRRVDGYINLTRTAEQTALTAQPALHNKPGFVVPIGHFRDAYQNSRDRIGARRELGIDHNSPVIAFTGFIRPYKNVPTLIDAFASLQSPNARLIVAGQAFDRKLESQILERAARDSRVILRLGFLNDHELDVVLNAADLVALPFKEILNSASAILALSFNRPVLVPNRGSLPELRRVAGPEWVVTYDGELSARTLSDALERASTIDPAAIPRLEALNWSLIADQTIRAYEAVMAAPRAR